MKKIISLFQRNSDGEILNQVNPEAEWVVAGEGIATRMFNGSCCLLHEGHLYKRHVHHLDQNPPEPFYPVEEMDPQTGLQAGWVPVGGGPEDCWHREAMTFMRNKHDGTYELCGPQIKNNPELFDSHVLIPHGAEVLDAPRDFHGLEEWFSDKSIEGIVWRHPDGRMAKIKKKDFHQKRGYGLLLPSLLGLVIMAFLAVILNFYINSTNSILVKKPEVTKILDNMVEAHDAVNHLDNIRMEFNLFADYSLTSKGGAEDDSDLILRGTEVYEFSSGKWRYEVIGLNSSTQLGPIVYNGKTEMQKLTGIDQMNLITDVKRSHTHLQMFRLNSFYQPWQFLYSLEDSGFGIFGFTVTPDLDVKSLFKKYISEDTESRNSDGNFILIKRPPSNGATQGRIEITFDPKHNYYPVKTLRFDGAGRLVSTISVLEIGNISENELFSRPIYYPKILRIEMNLVPGQPAILIKFKTILHDPLNESDFVLNLPLVPHPWDIYPER